jgi:cytochrome c peroxidase
MGSTWDGIIKTLKSDPSYNAAFARAYPDGVTVANVRNSLAAFESTLVTVDSRFDQFLQGDRKALSAEELAGYSKFKAYGCISCHQGVNVGGNMFQSMGVMGDYFGDRGTPITAADQGRFAVTGNPADMHSFRVPSLRNVELTAPYFHDGSAPDLQRAVEVMAKYQLGLKIPAGDRDAIVKFLGTLTGRKPATAAGAAGQ